VLKCIDDVNVNVTHKMMPIMHINTNTKELLWNTYVYMDFDKPYAETKVITWRTKEVKKVKEVKNKKVEEVEEVEITDGKKTSSLYGRVGYHILAFSGAPCCSEFKIKHDTSEYCDENTMLSNVLTEGIGSMLPLTSIRLCHFILQEYFVPATKLHDMLQTIHATKELQPLLFNISVRKVKGTPEPMLSWSPNDCIAIVLFFNIFWIRLPQTQSKITVWTNKLINKANSLGGSFYLPYLRTYDNNLITKCYPRLHEFLAYKDVIDPTGKFTSQFHRGLPR
jgi:hypothetical protein